MGEFPAVVLPLPPTDNRLRMPVRFGKGSRLVLTKDYRAWKEDLEITWLQWAGENRRFRPHKGSSKKFLLFQYQIFLPSWQSDAQNYEKALRDGLEGYLFENDRYVYIQAVAAPVIDKYNARVVLNPNPKILA